ncbi:hypothetical protein FACS189490_09480 [Clostridia bacterium]|nr:hypothetical protein FACS189490_09480 [Clostridia bacterium]
MKATREEMTAKALQALEAMDAIESLVDDLRDNGKIRMSEQWLKNAPDVTPGCCQSRTYFDNAGNMYDVYRYVSGLRECYDACEAFENETWNFVFHMHFTISEILGQQLTMLFVLAKRKIGKL